MGDRRNSAYRQVVPIADEDVVDVGVDFIVRQEIPAPHVFQKCRRRMLRYPQRSRRGQKRRGKRERRVDVRLVEHGHVAAERQSLGYHEARDDFDALHVDARCVARFRSKFTRRADLARHGYNQVLYATREVGRRKGSALAEVGGESAVPLARNLRLQIGIAEAGEEQLVKCRRPKAFGIAATQGGRDLRYRNRDRPCGADFLAELAVAIDSKTAGDKNAAVEKTTLLFEVARVFLAACSEQAYRRYQRRRRGEVRECEDAIRADPSIFEIESYQRAKALEPGPGEHRLDKSAASLVGNAILLAAHET